MWKDTIVEESRKPGELLAKRFNYDVHKIFEYLRKQEKKHDKKMLITKHFPVNKTN